MTLEGIIDHDRYQLQEFVNRGCWGAVYAATDTILDVRVAIKVLDPNTVALEQMKVRKLDSAGVMRKEALALQPCAHIVPRTLEVDKKGKQFIVMPFYEQFFSDVLERAKSSREMYYWNGKQEERLPSGLCLTEVIRYSRSMVHAVAEVHETYHRAHCDIKPDNFAVAEDGRLLITDLGTATVASIQGVSPRDNMGHLYTRSPRLFFEGTHPSRKTDVFAIGSMIYKMFEGEYLLESEIKAAGPNVQALMEKIGGRYGYGYEFSSLIERKLAGSKMPNSFKTLVRDCALGYYDHGESVRRVIEQVIDEARNEQAITKVREDLKSEAKGKFRDGLLTGVAGMGFLLGCTLLAPFMSAPDYSRRQEVEFRLGKHKVEDAKVRFELEGSYHGELRKREYHEFAPLRELHESRYQSKTLVDVLTREWIWAAEDTGVDLLENNSRARYNQIFGMTQGRATHNTNELIREMLTYSASANRIDDERIDLEDTCTMAAMGLEKLRRAQRASGSLDFKSYISAKENGEYVIPEEYQNFLKRLLERAETALPGKVVRR